MTKEFKKKVESILEYIPSGNKISIEWTTGGMTGGNCWGGEANQAVEGEPEPEFTDLDTLQEALCPNISLFQYKRLCKDVVIQDSRTQGEYYGNYYYKSSKTVDLDQLEKWLKKEDLYV